NGQFFQASQANLCSSVLDLGQVGSRYAGVLGNLNLFESLLLSNCSYTSSEAHNNILCHASIMRVFFRSHVTYESHHRGRHESKIAYSRWFKLGKVLAAKDRTFHSYLTRVRRTRQ